MLLGDPAHAEAVLVLDLEEEVGDVVVEHEGVPGAARRLERGVRVRDQLAVPLVEVGERAVNVIYIMHRQAPSIIVI